MRKRFVIGCAAALLLWLLCPATTFAQGGSGTTIITGTVADSSGAVLPGASVVAKNAATAEELTAVTNEQGQFTIPAVQPGTYTVTVTMDSFKTAEVSNVRVNAGVPASAVLKLSIVTVTV